MPEPSFQYNYIIVKKKNIKKKAAIISLVVFAILAISGVASLIIAKNITPSILLTKTTYHYPYKEVIKIEEDGKIYKSKTVDELTANGAPQDEFTYRGTISNNELQEIRDIINQMKAEEKKSENFSESYGIAVYLGENTLYGCEYFAQEEVDKLNIIIEKYKQKQ